MLRATAKFAEFTRGSHLLGVIVALLAVYVFGALIAMSEGMLSDYIGWYVLVAILVMIGWATVWLEWAAKIYVDLLEKWRGNFGQDYESLLEKHVFRMFDNRKAFWLVVPILVTGLGDILTVRLSHGTLAQVATISNWIVMGPLPLFIFLMVVLTTAGYIGGVFLYFTLDHLRFMRELSRLNLIPYRLLSAEAHLSDLSYVGIVISLIWFGCVAIGGVILYGDFNPLTTPVYLAAAGVGIGQFLLPQFYLHELVKGAKYRLKETLRGLLPSGWHEPEALRSSGDNASLLVLIQQTDKIPDWPIDVPVLTFELMAAFIPFVVTAGAQVVGLTFR